MDCLCIRQRERQKPICCSFSTYWRRFEFCSYRPPGRCANFVSGFWKSRDLPYHHAKCQTVSCTNCM